MFGVSNTTKLNPPPSDIWFQKQRAYFNSLDSDNNGSLSARDRDLLIRDFDSHPHGSQFKGRFHETMNDIWSFLELGPKMKYEDFLEQRLVNLKKKRENPEHTKIERFSYYKLIFDLTDVDQDKHWDEEEGVMHFHIFCRDMHHDEAVRQLKKLDRQGLGKVAFSDFAERCFQFDFDEKPGDHDDLYDSLPSVSSSRPKGY